MAEKENKPKVLPRVLLIEDQDHYVDNLTRRMQKLNWEPTLTSSYSDAFKLLEFETFDAVCIDIRLGHMAMPILQSTAKSSDRRVRKIARSGWLPTVSSQTRRQASG